MARGQGKGYKNIVGKDPKVHSDSAKGRKQPQKLSMLKKVAITKNFKLKDMDKEQDLRKKSMSSEVNSYFFDASKKKFECPACSGKGVIEKGEFSFFNKFFTCNLCSQTGVLSREKVTRYLDRFNVLEDYPSSSEYHGREVAFKEAKFIASQGEKMSENLPKVYDRNIMSLKEAKHTVNKFSPLRHLFGNPREFEKARLIVMGDELGKKIGIEYPLSARFFSSDEDEEYSLSNDKSKLVLKVKKINPGVVGMLNKKGYKLIKKKKKKVVTGGSFIFPVEEIIYTLRFEKK